MSDGGQEEVRRVDEGGAQEGGGGEEVDQGRLGGHGDEDRHPEEGGALQGAAEDQGQEGRGGGKLTDKQTEFLKTIHGAGDTGYQGDKTAEAKSLEALLGKKLIKRGAKDKSTGHYSYIPSRRPAQQAPRRWQHVVGLLKPPSASRPREAQGRPERPSGRLGASLIFRRAAGRLLLTLRHPGSSEEGCALDQPGRLAVVDGHPGAGPERARRRTGRPWRRRRSSR